MFILPHSYAGYVSNGHLGSLACLRFPVLLVSATPMHSLACKSVYRRNLLLSRAQRYSELSLAAVGESKFLKQETMRAAIAPVLF